MRGKVVILVLSFLLCLPLLMQAQRSYDPETAKWTDRVFFGGNFGFSMFGGSFFLETSPLVGYMITPTTAAGGGVTYQFFRQRFQGQNFDTSIYGPRAFAMQNIYRSIFAYTELETLSVNVLNPADGGLSRVWVPGVMLGPGILQRFGNRGGVQLMILYNFTYDEQRSPYFSPWVFRVGLFL